MMRPAILLSISAATMMACSNDFQLEKSAKVAPTAVINAPVDQATVLENEVVEFLGTVADGNGLADIVTTTWVSSID